MPTNLRTYASAKGRFSSRASTTVRGMRMTADVDGLKELEAALRNMPVEMTGKNGGPLRKATRVAVKEILVPEAQRMAPVSKTGTYESIPSKKTGGKRRTDVQRVHFPPGRLRRAIRMAITKGAVRTAALKGGSSFEGYVVGVNAGKSRADGEGAWYAYIVERGSPKRAATPFLRPAIFATKDKLVARFKSLMWEHIEKYARQEAAKAPPLRKAA